MKYAYEYLQKLGYIIPESYYSKIDDWIQIWKGKSEWLEQIRTIDNKPYPMYSLGMAKRSCEDLASTITSEPFEIKAKKNNKQLKESLQDTKILEKLPEAIEIMGYTGTVGTVARIINAEMVGEGETATLKKGAKTKTKVITIKANQIIPLTIEDDEIVNCAFVSEQKRKINGKIKKIIYMELHELTDKGYQVTNKYFDKENGDELFFDNVIETYNTLSDVPLFSINKMPKSNPIDDNGGLGIALFGDSIDQLKMLDLTYNNFGMDFKLGQKIMIINKKLTRIETEQYTDKDGIVKQRPKIYYPSDLQKQQFMEITDGVMGNVNNNSNSNPYIFEHNPDLRVGSNKEGVQFALDNYSFKIGFGTHYYSFENGNLTTATEAVISRKDFVDNGNKVRKRTNEYLKGICRALLLCEKILGKASIDEHQEIEIAEVDGFLEDDNTQREKLMEDMAAGVISKKKYLMKVYKMTEKEADEELQNIEKENSASNIDLKLSDEDDEESEE